MFVLLFHVLFDKIKVLIFRVFCSLYGFRLCEISFFICIFIPHPDFSFLMEINAKQMINLVWPKFCNHCMLNDKLLHTLANSAQIRNIIVTSKIYDDDLGLCLQAQLDGDANLQIGCHRYCLFRKLTSAQRISSKKVIASSSPSPPTRKQSQLSHGSSFD